MGRRGGQFYPIPPLPAIGAQLLGFEVGQETSRKQAEGVQFLDLSAVLDIRLFALRVLGELAIGQDHLETEADKFGVQVLPVVPVDSMATVVTSHSITHWQSAVRSSA